jgi:hypothetical protein
MRKTLLQMAMASIVFATILLLRAGLHRRHPGKRSPRTPVVATKDAGAPRELFAYASITDAPAKEPARFQALPPLRTADLEHASELYPFGQAMDAICQGHGGLRERLLEALAQGGEARTPAEHDDIDARLNAPTALARCSEPSFCAWALAHVGEPTPPLARRVLLHALDCCTGPEVDAFFEKSAPPEAAARRREQEPICRAGLHPRPGAPSRPAPKDGPLRDRIASPDPDLEDLVRIHGRDAVIVALERCAARRDGASLEAQARGRCLRHLAELDRRRAHALARSTRAPVPSLSPLWTALARHAAPGALEARLHAIGLLPQASAKPPAPRRILDEPPVPAKRALLTAEEHLAEWGRIFSFATATADHDRILANLAKLAGPDLDGVLFEDVVKQSRSGPPQGGPPDGSPGDKPSLVAYLGGSRIVCEREDRGAALDLPRVLGFVNALLKRKNSPVRLLLLAGRPETARVVAGPETALRAAVREGLLAASRGDGEEPERR